MWEVDPETRRKIFRKNQEIIFAKIGKILYDFRQCEIALTTIGECSGSPSPQWASPKFGIFICLTCAGVHRGLGVHISFVRSITMDQFKTNEIARMDKGGNQALQAYFESCPEFSSDMSIIDRYSAPFAEDYKEKLTCMVEDREWSGPAPRKAAPAKKMGPGSNLSTPRSGSPAIRGTSQKEQNEEYFAKMGRDNLSRPDHVPPSQGGKYGGFGSAPLEDHGSGSGIGGWDDVTKDPVGALSKGWGFFASTVAKGAKTVNESVVKPTAQMIAESDIQSTVTRTATNLGSTVASTAKTTADSLNRMIDQQQRGHYTAVQPERQDFWDSFGGDEWDAPTTNSKPSAVGTSGIKKKTTTGFGNTGSSAHKDDDWADEKW